ncbi:MAG: hypothetical protein WCF10_17845 [Polyangiales bacterium]
MKRIMGLQVLCLVLACSASFLPAWAVTNLRVVGALIEVDGKPGRANPDPLDGVQVTLRVIDQGAPPSEFPEVPALTPPLLQWSFLACIAVPSTIGPPICGPQIQPCDGCVAAPPDDPIALPVMRFQVPSQAVLDAAQATRVLLQGAICADGPPAGQDAILRFILGETNDLNPCANPADEGRFVSVSIPIEQDPADPELNPEITTVTLNGYPWPPPYDQDVSRTAPRTGCRADLDGLSAADRDAQPVAGSPAWSIKLAVNPDSFQSYTVDGVTLTEEMQVSWLTDGGSFENSFSFIVQPAESVLTMWQAPASAPEDGTLVRFNFVIRDGRGGTDWVERGLCVLPPQPNGSPP